MMRFLFGVLLMLSACATDRALRQAETMPSRPLAWFEEDAGQTANELSGSGGGAFAESTAPSELATAAPDVPPAPEPESDYEQSQRSFEEAWVKPLPQSVIDRETNCFGVCSCGDSTSRLLEETQCQRRRRVILNAPLRQPGTPIPKCSVVLEASCHFYAGGCPAEVCKMEPAFTIPGGAP